MYKQAFKGNIPLLIIAPHLEYPALNGADISLDRIGKYFSMYAPYVDIIGANEIIRYQQTKISHAKKFNNKIRTKKCAALRTLLNRSNYLKEKFVTQKYTDVLNKYIKDLNDQPINILCSYIFSADLLNTDIKIKNYCMIWTHNDDYKWFRDFYTTTNNIFIKLIAKFSLNWTWKFIENNKADFLLLHVDDNDIKGYNKEHTHLNNLRVDIGTDIPDLNYTNKSTDTSSIILSFVGSLSVQMNVDALKLFSDKYFGVIQSEFKNRLLIQVIGSNPTDLVYQLCKKNNWIVKANVSDTEMKKLLNITTFTMLPFEYTNGAKLKMLFSLGNGIPFLATTTMSEQIKELPPFCLFSNNPTDWLQQIKLLINQPTEERIKIKSQISNFAQKFSWEASVKKIIKSLETAELS